MFMLMPINVVDTVSVSRRADYAGDYLDVRIVKTTYSLRTGIITSTVFVRDGEPMTSISNKHLPWYN